MRQHRGRGNDVHAGTANRGDESPPAWLPDTGLRKRGLTGRVSSVALLTSATIIFTGCGALIKASRTPTHPPVPQAWAQASALAATRVGAGSYSAADRLLIDFATLYPGTPQAAEAMLCRAMYKADPANQAASPRDATALIDSTLALPLDSANRADAYTLRRVTTALERAATLAASSAPASAANPGSPARTDDAKASSDEVQRLRAELAKANAELERIKKRVSQPKP